MKKVFALFLLFSSVVFCDGRIPDYFGVPIEQAMGLSEQEIQSAFSRKSWQVIRDWYNKHVVNATWSIEPLIPKIIHHIWLGSPLPEKCELLRETWKKYHPDWEFILWTDEDIEAFGLTSKDLYDQTDNYGVRSDIARHEILYRIGGLYVDTDFECVKPFDVFHHCCDFYTGVAAHTRVIAYNGLIASAPGHPILKHCIESLSPREGESESYDDMQVRTGPFFFTEAFVMSCIRYDGPAVALPAKYFYPMPHYARSKKSREDILKWVNPETFAIHHWHCSWAK